MYVVHYYLQHLLSQCPKLACHMSCFLHIRNTAQLISTFVFATQIVQSCFFLNLQVHLMWLYSPVCVGPGQKPRRQVFSCRGSYVAVQVGLYLTWLENYLDRFSCTRIEFVSSRFYGLENASCCMSKPTK